VKVGLPSYLNTATRRGVTSLPSLKCLESREPIMTESRLAQWSEHAEGRGRTHAGCGAMLVGNKREPEQDDAKNKPDLAGSG
jgi:hypothetical protein